MEMKWKVGARILGIHPKFLSRLKKKYLSHGGGVLTGRKPGPKQGAPDNKTSDCNTEDQS